MTRSDQDLQALHLNPHPKISLRKPKETAYFPPIQRVKTLAILIILLIKKMSLLRLMTTLKKLKSTTILDPGDPPDVQVDPNPRIRKNPRIRISLL